MNVIKLAIGSGILLLSCGAYSQSISEKTNSDKKGAAEFSPLSVSVGKMTSEQEALEKTGATSSRTTDKNLQSLDATFYGYGKHWRYGCCERQFCVL